MRPCLPNFRILLIGRRNSYLTCFTQALEGLNYSVRWMDLYEHPPVDDFLREEMPDLVVLNCLSIGNEEDQLITHLLMRNHHLLVVATFLPMEVMRRLFLLGVDDVTDRPCNPQHLIAILQQTLKSISWHEPALEEMVRRGNAR